MIVDNPDYPHAYHIVYWGKKDDVAGTPIERYYDDFRHVRIVPFNVINERIHSENSSAEYGEIASSFQRRMSEGVDYDRFYETPNDDTVDYTYRWLIKMNWLINDIQKRGCKEPITGVIRPKFREGKLTYDFHVHPGTFRRHAFTMMNCGDDCIVFDAFELFHDYPKASLSELLELFEDEAGTHVEISMLPQHSTYLTPQILNMHPDGINCSMTPTMKAYEKEVRHLFDKKVNIFIGYDSRHSDATNVCHNTILDNIPKEDKKHINIQHLDVSKIDGWTREYKNQSTEFSYTRFLVPHLSNYEGISIFVDDDFVFTENIMNLVYYINHEKAVSVVKHDFSKKYDTKFGNQKDVWYPKKLWSSLMVFNNSHPDCKKLTLESVQEATGQYLHQFEWTDSIGELPKEWNWCEGYSPAKDMHKSFGLHWTRGGPWIEGMDTSDISGLELYDTYRLRWQLGFTYEGKNVSILDMRNYYDIENPVDENQDGCLICYDK